MPAEQHGDLKLVIEAVWEDRDAVTHDTKGPVREAVLETIERLDAGLLRVAEREADGTWVTHQWAKQAILLFFRLTPNALVHADAPGPYWDKVPLKFTGWDAARFEAAGVRVLPEPLQANPTIIEDNCFIGARSEVAEGVIVREGSVLSMGVYLTSTTPIVDRKTGAVITGEVPPYSVIMSGSRPSPHEGMPSTYCAVIMKTVDERTRSKTSINELLRD